MLQCLRQHWLLVRGKTFLVASLHYLILAYGLLAILAIGLRLMAGQ